MKTFAFITTRWLFEFLSDFLQFFDKHCTCIGDFHLTFLIGLYFTHLMSLLQDVIKQSSPVCDHQLLPENSKYSGFKIETNSKCEQANVWQDKLNSLSVL